MAARGTAPVAFAALLPPLAAASAVALGCGFVVWADPTTPGGVLPVCPTKALLGIDCPGCGALRMTYSLLRGDLPAALHYNAVALATLPLLLYAWAAWTVGRWRGHQVRSWQHRRWAPTVALVVTLTWWVVRNLPMRPFSDLRV
ncbi:MAG: hypothetical protein QOI54_2875 [Actinomycetota bacterium]|nr:hypothetical protein [Actinomycetota bacterium]